MGNCCAAKTNQPRGQPLRAPKPHSTFKELASRKEQKMISRQHQICLLRENKLLIYDTDSEVAWVEDISMRGRVSGEYSSVKTGPNELFIVYGSYVLLIDMSIRTGRDRASPPFPLCQCTLCYQNRLVFVASSPPLCYNLSTNQWKELPRPSFYPENSGAFLVDDNWYIVGGRIRTGIADSVLVFSLLAETWMVASVSLPIPLLRPTCLPLSSSQILISSDSRTFLFDLVQFSPISAPSPVISHSVSMAIAYGLRAFVVHSDGEAAVYSGEAWTAISMEKIAQELANPDTEMTLDEEMERKRMKIPKKPLRPERLYAYSAVVEEEECFLVELNTVSLESRQVELAIFAPRPFPNCGICLLSHNIVLFAGGLTPDDSEVTQCLLLDCNSPHFLPAGDLPEPQAFLSMTSQSSSVYAIGSRSKRTPLHRVPVECYFQRFLTEEDRWETLESPPCLLHCASLSALFSEIYTIAGMTMKKNDVVDFRPAVCVYSTAEKTWKRLECSYPIPAARPHTVNLTPNRLLVFAGSHLNSASANVQTFIFDGKRFIEKGEVSSQGDLVCAVSSEDSNSILFVDIRGLFRVWSAQSGLWEEEREELRASVY